MKIFIEPIKKIDDPAAYYKFYHFLNASLHNSNFIKTKNYKNADIFISFVFNDKEPKDYNPEKLLILDWSDNKKYSIPKCFLYFKKSWSFCNYHMPVCVKKPPPIIPVNWRPLQEMALPVYFLPPKEKFIDVTCPLRESGKADSPNRKLVLNTVKSMQLKNSIIGALHEKKFGRESWIHGQPKQHHDYLNLLSQSKIIVTCGPSLWEGDSRFWESLASGACVLSDKISADMGFNPVHGKHCFYYDLQNLDSLRHLLYYLLKNPTLCKKIGLAGKKLAFTKHQPLARLKQIVNEFINFKLKII